MHATNARTQARAQTNADLDAGGMPSTNEAEARCATMHECEQVSGEVQVAGSKGDMDIDVWVTTLQGVVLYHRCAPSHGKLSFQTPVSDGARVPDEGTGYGDYADDEDTFRLCVEHQQVPSTAHDGRTRRVVALRLRDVDAALWKRERVASNSDTDKLLRAMRVMHTSLAGMIGDLTALEMREKGLTASVVGTASRVTAMAFVSFVVIVAISVAQVRYYRDFFKAKKLC